MKSCAGTHSGSHANLSRLQNTQRRSWKKGKELDWSGETWREIEQMLLNYAIPVFSTVASWSLPFPWHCRRLLGRLFFLPEEHSTNAGTSKIEHDLIKAIAGEIWSAPITLMIHNASVGQFMNHMLKTDGPVFISLPLLLFLLVNVVFGSSHTNLKQELSQF